MTPDFDRDTAVTPVGDATFGIDLDDRWSVGGGLNGGFLLAVVADACRQAVPGKPHVVTASAHYLGAGRPGPAEVHARVVRDGRSLATVAAELHQQGESRLTALVTMGDLGGLPDDVDRTPQPPAMPPPEECPGREQMPPDLRAIAPMTEQFDLRADPSHLGWALGSPSGRGVMQGWFRLEGGREPDPRSLLLVLDALPPATFDLGLMGWAPTIELTAHVRALPAPGWLRVRHQVGHVAGGMFEEDCEVWDSRGRLVAQSRQLARLPR
ncbi:thioesterase family protein [Nocardioides sp.]|uniref:thioesterase family protein n=1 Tax=Nocardioides sp. TaxID=35761 RepID=UPI003528DF13